MSEYMQNQMDNLKQKSEKELLKFAQEALKSLK